MNIGSEMLRIPHFRYSLLTDSSVIVSPMCRPSLCGLVVRVSGCRLRGPGLDSWRYQMFFVAVGMERDPLSLARINDDLLEIKVAAPV
jgi:hypothetical protein